MKKRIGIFLAALLLLSSCGRDSGRLKMGAAGLGGTYQAFSDAFAKLESETNNREIEVRTTAGSAANLRRFRSSSLFSGKEFRKFISTTFRR